MSSTIDIVAFAFTGFGVILQLLIYGLSTYISTPSISSEA